MRELNCAVSNQENIKSGAPFLLSFQSSNCLKSSGAILKSARAASHDYTQIIIPRIYQ